VTRNAVYLFIRQVLEFGLFHADPHPGNFFVQPDGSIALLDYGMVGRVSDEMQRHLLRAGLAAIHFDSEALAEELYALGVASTGARHSVFVRDLDHVLHRYAGSSIAEISATQVANEVTAIAFRHRLQLPSELALMLRVIVMSDGLGLKLDPGFRFLDYANPLIRERWRARHGPLALMRDLGRGAAAGLELGAELPGRLGRLLSRVERGQLELKVTHEGLGPTVREFRDMLNRLALAVLLGATIVALGLGLAIGRPAGWPQLANRLLSLAFPLTLALGLWLVLGLWRSSRR
jgi:ubiquinone biosynthesis protein